jgi:AAA15 family ATPase/GTPase
MIKRIKINEFTAFKNADLKFSTGINLIVGENGSGKSHLLKLAYTLAKSSHKTINIPSQSKAVFQHHLAQNLLGVFKPESLGRLTRRKQGVSRAIVSVEFEKNKNSGFEFSFSTKSAVEVKLESEYPGSYAPAMPIFIPTKELLTLFPGLRGILKDYELGIDDTYPDLCDCLDRPILRGPKLEKIKNALEPIEEIIGGEIKKENGRFYLYQAQGGRLEIDLVAEGFRKLATLAFLLKNGSLTNETSLIWDEPEANLNPLLIKRLAEMLMELASQDFQIIIATHSLFLLKEIHILSHRYPKAKPRFFGIYLNESNEHEISTEDNLEYLEKIASLEAELEQSDRYSETLSESYDNV